MNNQLKDYIYLANPWLKQKNNQLIQEDKWVFRAQTDLLVKKEWDSLCTILVGPRQAGKTTLGMQVVDRVINQEKRFSELLYLNCDVSDIRAWVKEVTFITEVFQEFDLQKPIIFIDEVQRLESPGLLLKAIIDLKLPFKLIASGSSQLEFKAKVQEHLTGRQIECLVLPFSSSEAELSANNYLFGCYPGVVSSYEQSILLDELYKTYIKKDIIEILKIGKPDLMEKLITLVAHSSGQLVNYNSLATDLKCSIQTVQNYMDVLENTYIVKKITPFVGNKRKEITSNPEYFFIDNGFRNRAIQDFRDLDFRQDAGLLIEGFVFQELFKHIHQNRLPYKLHFWRTQSGAEIDFIVVRPEGVIPIEVKFRQFDQPKLTRAYHSFIEAYQPEVGVIVTKDYSAEIESNGCKVKFIPVRDMAKLMSVLS